MLLVPVRSRDRPARPRWIGVPKRSKGDPSEQASCILLKYLKTADRGAQIGVAEHSYKTRGCTTPDHGAMRIHDPVAIARDLSPFDFQELAPFNGAAFCMHYGDQLDRSDWELHPDTDELLMVLSGSVTVEILTDTDRHHVPLAAGQFAIVPKGHWHRHIEVDDVVEMFYTPGATIDSTADDPRTVHVAAGPVSEGAGTSAQSATLR